MANPFRFAVNEDPPITRFHLAIPGGMGDEEVNAALEDLATSFYVNERQIYFDGRHSLITEYEWDSADPAFIGPGAKAIMANYTKRTGNSAYLSWHSVIGVLSNTEE